MNVAAITSTTLAVPTGVGSRSGGRQTTATRTGTSRHLVTPSADTYPAIA